MVRAHPPGTMSAAPAQRRRPTRRAVIAGLAVSAGLPAGLTACTASEAFPARTGDTPPPGHPTTPAPTGSASTTTANAPITPTGSWPSKDQIVARFGARQGTRWELNTPGELTRMRAGVTGVALTFDACGGPGGSGYDRALIDLLRAHSVKATLVLNQRWIDANPGPAAELAADPLFQLANHGLRHIPLSTTGKAAYGERGTTSVAEMYDEIIGSSAWLLEQRPHEPIFYRSGTAYADEVAVAVCAAMGMPFLGFAVNGDAGTTFTADQIATALKHVRPGDIVISHMNQPTHQTAKGYTRALPPLLDRGITFCHVRDGARTTS